MQNWPETIAAEEGAKNPFLMKVHASQRQYASLAHGQDCSIASSRSEATARVLRAQHRPLMTSAGTLSALTEMAARSLQSDGRVEQSGSGMPAKRLMFPPYSFVANHYLPEGGAKAAASELDGHEAKPIAT